MKKVLYTKFNSTRKPEFRLSTSIVLSENGTYVVKRAMEDKANAFIGILKSNYDMLCSHDTAIVPVPFTEEKDGLHFDYIEGRHVLGNIDFHCDTYERILSEIEAGIDLLFDFSEENTRPFKMSRRFQEIFPECEVCKARSMHVTNIDSIFDNFVIKDGTIWCIDYEWVFDFDIPARYVLYRALHYLYQDKMDFLERWTDEASFLNHFRFDEKEISLYEKMERNFQQYVHGKDWNYIYTKHYEKAKNRICMSETEAGKLNGRIEDLTDEVCKLKETIALSQNHIGNLNAVIEDLNGQIEYKNQVIADYVAYKEKMDKALRNPFFAISCVIKKIIRKDG